MKKVIVIIGPTAVGKSALAVKLARRFNGEVISADSRQAYKGLTIGTGKITKKEMEGVHHHLLDIIDPKKTYTAADFVRDANKKIDEISARGKVPIICGGTGFYIDALLGNVTLAKTGADLALRKKLEAKRAEQLFALLEKKDPERAQNIDRHNKRRLIRALEVIEGTGRPPEVAGFSTEHRTRRRENTRREGPTDRAGRKTGDLLPAPLWIGLTLPRDDLRKNIHKRLLARIRQGMIAEAKRLHKKGVTYKRMQELGLEYRYLAMHLQGDVYKNEMLATLEPKIWQFAKRQMTYWKRNKDISWFEPSSKKEITKKIASFLSA